MFSSSRKFIIPLFVYLSLFLLAAQAHDSLLQQRNHANINMKRLMRKRAPPPQDSDVPLGGVVGAAPLPPSADTTTSASASKSTDAKAKTTSASSASSSSSLASSSASSSTSSSESTPSSSSVSSSSEAAKTSSAPTPTTPASDAVTQAPGVKTVMVGGKTLTSEVSPSETSIPSIASAASTNAKSTTITVLVAIVASVGGIFIIWTIFRKWKLSSSKEFDRRLNPINWQPTGEDDGPIPGQDRPRPPSVISNRSGAHGSTNHGHSNQNPFDDFDGPAKPTAAVGGYADLARGPSPNPQMQERVGAATYGNTYGAGPVPLHHQGY